MRRYLSFQREQRGSFSPEELEMLDILMRRLTRRLHIDDHAERNEIPLNALSIRFD